MADDQSTLAEVVQSTVDRASVTAEFPGEFLGGLALVGEQVTEHFGVRFGDAEHAL